MAIEIHPSAVVDKRAVIGDGTVIGPYAVIEGNVHLGKRVIVNPHAHIKGSTTIGDDTFIGTGAVIGEAAQIAGFHGSGVLIIGKNNTIREYVTIHSSSGADKATVLGDDNFLMLFAHVGHDCHIGNSVVICPSTLIAGHVHIDDRAFLSGSVVVHQFVHIGRGAMISGLSRVNQDVPPFMLLVGDSRIWGVNSVGAKRSGLTSSELKDIKSAFNILYQKKLPVSQAVIELNKMNSPLTKEIAGFVNHSERGICGPKRNNLMEKIFMDYPYFIRSVLPDALKLFLAKDKNNREKADA
jgi:UDP-N-acetylglucosamine acyltransferase